MSNYRRGANFERELIKLLTDNGYSCVRGAGSKGEVAFPGSPPIKADIIASKVSSTQERTVYILIMQAKLKKHE